MTILQYFKRAISYIKYGVPQQVVINKIVTLPPTQLLSGRVALITGGASGIGRAIAEQFVRSGGSVIITGRNEQKLVEVVSYLKQKHPKDFIDYEVMDISNISSFEEKLSSINDKLKGKHIDILVNNAGILGGSIHTCSDEEFDKIIMTNLKGAFFLSKAIAQEMIENQIHGNILNIESSSSLRPAVSAYMLSKWGLHGLTLGLAKLYIKNNIVVNGIAPGPTATPMMLNDDIIDRSLPQNPSKRYAEPIEIANAAVFLTSNLGKMIVGDTLFMTGGAGVITYDDVMY